MINVLVTGENSQLAKCINDLELTDLNTKFIYKNSQELDISNPVVISTFFKNNTINYCINCAAYTAVDKAEIETESADRVNRLGVKNLSISCNKHDVTLIHISTDFVFDGKKPIAYTETDETNPTGVYGLTKLQGEHEIKQNLNKYFILRTAWLYSEYGNNFMKSMINLSKDRDHLGVVVDQIGTPTYAKDLAEVILKIISTNSKDYGIYHYSNEGVASWYDFAKAIFEEKKVKIKIQPIKSEAYPTAAKRPHFSVLDKSKIIDKLKIEIPYWKESLKKAIANYNE